MRRSLLSTILLSAAFVAGCGTENIQEPSGSSGPALLERRSGRALDFTTIDVPGAIFTTAMGINPRGDIVGSYVDNVNGALRWHGYLLRDGAFTAIDFPDAAGTEARGIGPGGEIVGDYWLAGEPAVNVHGYLLTKQGEFRPVNYPGHTNTIAQRILPDGTILGCRHDNDTMGSMRGISFSEDGTSEIDVFASMNNGATPDGRRIVGLYTNTVKGRQEGYLIEDGVFTPLLVPGSLSTAAWDMNAGGEIVGVYRNATGVHGFVLNEDGYASIDVPGATTTRAFGVNSGGDVVGAYVSGGKTHGFVASRTRKDW